LIDEANDGFAIDGGGDGLAKSYVAKPFLFSGEIGGRFFAEVVEVEEEEVVFEAGACIGHRVAARLATEDREVFGAEAGEDVRLAGLKAKNLGVRARDEKKNKFVEIGETVSFCVGFPIVRISFEHQLLAGDVFLEAERAETGPLARLSGGGPELADLSFLVWFLEQMARQDGESVEKSFFDAVGLGESENQGLRVHFADGDGLAANNELIALGRMDIFIEVDAKGEENVVGVERMAVGKTQSLAKSERVLKAVRGDFPGFGESGLGELGGAIDMNQVGLHRADDFTRGSVNGDERI